MIFVSTSVFRKALFQSFDKFDNFIVISFFKSKICIKTLFFNIYYTGWLSK